MESQWSLSRCIVLWGAMYVNHEVPLSGGRIVGGGVGEIN